MGLAIAGAVTSAIGVIGSFLGASKASKRAKKAAKEEARLEGIVTTEKLRQLTVEQRVTEGEQIAAYAASGVKAPIVEGKGDYVGMSPGSPLDIIEEQKREFGFQRKVVADVGATKAGQALQAGRDTANAYKWQGYSNAASGIANIFSILKTR